jgi:hypothetical protein
MQSQLQPHALARPCTEGRHAVTDYVYVLASVVAHIYGLGAQPQCTKSLRQSEATSDLLRQRNSISPDFPTCPAVDPLLHLMSTLASSYNQW